MLTSVTNAVNFPQARVSDAEPVPEVRQSKPAVAVELPHQAVKDVAQVDAGTVKKAAAEINKVLERFDNNIQFVVDEDTKENVVKVVNAATHEVIRQMPSAEMLAIAKALDKLQGLLIREKA
ncbi:MAG TPA: flagellar protein FlaG [Gammaproteobacteria bacterium]|jgi:flagellar protein FlaG|nr:flagellar protein FlaG [Gammaproteobacteria bacterium]